MIDRTSWPINCKPHDRGSKMDNPKTAVLALERLRIAFTNDADLDSLDGLLADDYIHVHANGVVENKVEFIREIAKIRRTVEPRQPAVRLYGPVAILTGEMINHFQLPEGPRKVRLYATQVAHCGDAEWKFVSFQAVLLSI